jgi:hypothetical protein
MGLLGKMVHLGIDAVLITTVLSGIKRSTGLTYVPAPHHVGVTPALSPDGGSLGGLW